MTDTLITVDLQFQKLLQRAREGQAAGREVQVDREQQRKIETAGRAERGVRERITIPGQVLQQGRSRRGVRGGPQNVTKRPKEQPAAGYVPQVPEVAYGYLTTIYPSQSPRLYSGDGNKYQDITFADPTGSGTLPDAVNGIPVPPLSGSYTVVRTYSFSIVLPVGGKTFLYLIQKTVGTRTSVWSWQSAPDGTGGIVWNLQQSDSFTTGPLSPEFCVVSRSTVRKVNGMPSRVAEWMALALNRITPLADEPLRYPYESFQFLSQGLSDQLGKYNDKVFSFNHGYAPQVGFAIRLGTPAGIRSIDGGQPGWSPIWLNFAPPESLERFLQGYRIKSLDAQSHAPADTVKGAIIRGLKITLPQLPGGTDELSESSPQRLIAWDWGKPAQCRQLLLQLGFSPSDLSP
jgi:hypothetical protein